MYRGSYEVETMSGAVYVTLRLLHKSKFNSIQLLHTWNTGEKVTHLCGEDEGSGYSAAGDGGAGRGEGALRLPEGGPGTWPGPVQPLSSTATALKDISRYSLIFLCLITPLLYNLTR